MKRLTSLGGSPYARPLDLCSFCYYSTLVVDYGCYILRRQRDGPCEYSTWITVAMLDLVPEGSMKLFIGWPGHCSASTFSENASSKFPIHLAGNVAYCERFEKASIRLIRGLSALCLLVIFVAVAYDVLVVQPFNDQSSIPVARYLNPTFSDLPILSMASWMVSIVGVVMQTHGN